MELLSLEKLSTRYQEVNMSTETNGIVLSKLNVAEPIFRNENEEIQISDFPEMEQNRRKYIFKLVSELELGSLKVINRTFSNTVIYSDFRRP